MIQQLVLLIVASAYSSTEGCNHAIHMADYRGSQTAATAMA
jgi:hypothetical protein